MAARKIDDAEPAVSKSQLAIEVETFVVRTTVNHGGSRARESAPVRRSLAAEIKDSRDAAHMGQAGGRKRKSPSLCSEMPRFRRPPVASVSLAVSEHQPS